MGVALPHRDAEHAAVALKIHFYVNSARGGLPAKEYVAPDYVAPGADGEGLPSLSCALAASGDGALGLTVPKVRSPPISSFLCIRKFAAAALPRDSIAILRQRHWRFELVAGIQGALRAVQIELCTIKGRPLQYIVALLDSVILWEIS